MIIIQKKDNINFQEGLTIRTGKAFNIVKDRHGKPVNWEFEQENSTNKKNVICTAGINFIFTRNWGVPMSIVVGNGSTSGANAPAITDTTITGELANGRFGVRGDANSRVRNGTITLSALWPRGQTFTGDITNFGIFAVETGNNATQYNSGFLVARAAQAFTRTDVTKDVELVWVITITAS